MDIARGINRYLDALAAAREPLREPAVLMPFVIFALLQIAILSAMAMFLSPPLATVMVPVMHFLGGDDALHYPLHLVGLPDAYRKVYLPLVATVGFALWSFAAWKMVDHHPGGPGKSVRSFLSALPHAIAVGVLFVGISVGVSHLMSSLITPKTPGMAVRGLVVVSVALTAVLQALLVHAPFALRVSGTHVWGALRASVRYARRNFFATVLLVTTVLVVNLPLDFLLAHADRVASRFHPETILRLMMGAVALEMLTAYLLFAGITELDLPHKKEML